MLDSKNDKWGPSVDVVHVVSVVEILNSIKEQLGYELNCSS